MAMNTTIEKFGYPKTLLAAFTHWVLLVRPSQVTAGSLILAARSDATAFGDLPPPAYAELSVITASIEAMLRAAVDYEKINYLMLMMVDPHVHFHIFPRYDGQRTIGGTAFPDLGWPGPPELRSGLDMTADRLEQIRLVLAEHWPVAP